MSDGRSGAQPLTPTEILDRAHLLAEQLAGSMDEVAHSFGLTRQRMQVLFVLGHTGPLGQAEIAEHLGCSRRLVTAFVDGLAATGHVERTTPEGDRRRRVVTLLPPGDEVVSTIDRARRDATSALFAGLDADDLQAFGRVATHLVGRLSGTELSRLESTRRSAP